MKRSAPSRGFTLLEALVVLVITGLISVVLVQGFGLLLSARTSVQDKIVAVDEALVEQNLFLEPLRGVVPDYPDRPHMFIGEPQRLHGLTARPLQARAGSPVPFTLTITYERQTNRTSLTYQEDNTEPMIIGSWEGEKGAFAYRDIAGAWRDTWPVQDDQKAPQTPWLIRISKGTGFPANLVASVGGTHRRPLRFRDTPFGSDAPSP